MKLKNTGSGYGLVSILLHWVMAFLLIGLYFLGDYMVDLDYYDDWYHTAPDWHKALGLIALALLLLRMGWKYLQTRPAPLASYHAWEITLASLTHAGFYLVLLVVCFSGYFMSTAKGAAVDVFGWFEIAALTRLDKDQAALAADVHEISTTVFILMVLLHVAAALKHQFVDKDRTLFRILKPVSGK